MYVSIDFTPGNLNRSYLGVDIWYVSLKQASVDWGRNTAAIVEKSSLTDPLFLEHVGHLGNRPSSTRDVRGCKKHLKVTNQSYYANLSG